MANAKTQKRKKTTEVVNSDKNFQYFPSLNFELRSHVGTACAAFHLNRTSQTLRKWACYENGPVRAHRINGRLSWPVADIKRVLNGGK
jgi:hypothetical protein